MYMHIHMYIHMHTHAHIHMHTYTYACIIYIDYDDLAKPVNDCLLFAGEATNRKNPATVAGAYLSGLRTAGTIQYLGLQLNVCVCVYVCLYVCMYDV